MTEHGNSDVQRTIITLVCLGSDVNACEAMSNYQVIASLFKPFQSVQEFIAIVNWTPPARV